MASPRVTIRVGRATWGRIPAELMRQTILQVAEAGVKRTQKRVDHPATRALKARSVNSRQASIVGSRGGPGIIRPVRANALSFDWRGRRWNLKSVRGKGFEPLIRAEVSRVKSDEIDTSKIKIN